MSFARALSSDELRRASIPAVVMSAAFGLTPHILLLGSSVAMRLGMIILMHAVIVPCFTWIALRHLALRARRLEEANLKLARNAEDLARRNAQIDALNLAFRLLAGAPSIRAVVRPVAELAQRIAQADGVTFTWREAPAGAPVVATAGAPAEGCAAGADGAPGGERSVELLYGDQQLGAIAIRGALENEFTQNSLAVLASEIELIWRLRDIEGRAISALSETVDAHFDLDGRKQVQRVLAPLCAAVGARGAAIYQRRGGEWVLRAAYGEDGDREEPPDACEIEGDAVRSTSGDTVFIGGGAGAALALRGAARGARAERALNVPLLRVATGHMVSLLNTADKCLELLWAERSRIGGELHDDACQTMAFLLMQLGHLEDLIESGRHNEAATRARQLRAEALDAYDGVRRAVDGLRRQPRPAESAGEFLRRVAGVICERNGIALRTDFGEVDIGQECAWRLGRVLQEAVNNSARHGGAHEIVASLRRQGEAVSLIVEDDGEGFADAPGSEAAPDPAESHGLAIMREQLAALHGTVDIVDSGHGVRVVARVPGTAA